MDPWCDFLPLFQEQTNIDIILTIHPFSIPASTYTLGFKIVKSVASASSTYLFTADAVASC